MTLLIRVILTPLLLGAALWSAAAIWIDGPASRPIAGLLALAAPTAMALLLLRVRPMGRAVLVSLLPFAAVLAWWLSLEPSNTRDWLPEVARLPSVRIEGDRATISNVRHFSYRSETDFDERWEERSYDLSELRGVDMFFVYWGSPHIAHTIVSWEFADGEQLAISIETRKEQGEAYSALLGFFRQFELYYVVADERDLIGLRAAHRREDVYLYRLRHSVDFARGVLLEYFDEINRLAEQPRWYNALSHNCTTAIRERVQHVSPGRPFDWRVLVNGYLDQAGYENGTIDTSLPFEELRRRSNVSEAAAAADGAEDFSQRIRQGVPLPPERRG